MQVILLRWEVMGMPFACGNEAAADVWREAIRIISLLQIIFTFVWFGFAMLHCAHCCSALVCIESELTRL